MKVILDARALAGDLRREADRIYKETGGPTDEAKRMYAEYRKRKRK